MSEFKKEWTLESAMAIVQHPTVDSRIWAEAVEWLLLYGPPEIQEILKNASGYATGREFPQLKSRGFAKNGEPVYAVAEIAEVLGISEEEAAELIVKKEARHGMSHRVEKDEIKKVQ